MGCRQCRIENRQNQRKDVSGQMRTDGYDSSDNSDDKPSFKKGTERHSSNSLLELLRGTLQNLSLQMSKGRSVNEPTFENLEPKEESLTRIFRRFPIKSSIGDPDEESTYKKINAEGHLPNPRPNGPRAPPPRDILDQ